MILNESPGTFYILYGYINYTHNILYMVIVNFTTNLLGGLAFGIDSMSAQRREFLDENITQGVMVWGLGSSVG